MDAKLWIRAVGLAMPGDGGAGRITALSALVPKLTAEFERTAFTLNTAQRVGQSLVETPDYDTLAGALRRAMPVAETRADPGDGPDMGAAWGGYAARRLAEGGPRAHLLSLVRAYCPAAALRGVLGKHFPAELAEMDQRAVEAKRDKAAAVEAYAAKLARTMAPPPPPKGPAAAVPTPATPEAPRERLITGEHLAAMRAKAAAAVGR